jgi:hypothetical protein
MLYKIVGIRSAGYLACTLLLSMILKKSQMPVIASHQSASKIPISSWVDKQDAG